MTRELPQLAAVIECLLPGISPEYIAACGLAGTFVSFAGTADVSPREAWELLATRGLIPDAWVQDERRLFDASCPRCRGRGKVPEMLEGMRVVRGGREGWDPCPACERQPHPRKFSTGRTTMPHPPTLAAVVALAADPQRVTDAEAISREYAASLWGMAAPRFVWSVRRVEEIATNTSVFGSLAWKDALYALGVAQVAMSTGADQEVHLAVAEVASRLRERRA